MLTSGTAECLGEQYADLLAFDWRRRAQLLKSPASDVSDLIAWDDRMHASVNALLYLGTSASHHLSDPLAEPIHAGQAFVVLLYALTAGDDKMLQAAIAIAIACSLPHLQPALVAAIEWAPASSQLQRVVEALPLPLRLQALAARHRDMPSAVEPAFGALRDSEPTPDAICAALRCLQSLGDAYRAQAGIHHLDHDHEAVRFVAAQTLLALAPTQQAASAVPALLRIAQHVDSPWREAAVCCLALHAAPRAMPELAALAAHRAGRRLHLQSLGWAGDITAVPHLIEHLDDPVHGRIAAASLSLLTGSDPVRDGWQGDAPSRTEALVDPDTSHSPVADPDAQLAWPSRAAFVLRWSAARARFMASSTWFAGHPASADVLARVITTGPLAWRSLAASRLQRLTRGTLFPTHLDAPAQVALFKTLS